MKAFPCSKSSQTTEKISYKLEVHSIGAVKNVAWNGKGTSQSLVSSVFSVPAGPVGTPHRKSLRPIVSMM